MVIVFSVKLASPTFFWKWFLVVVLSLLCFLVGSRLYHVYRLNIVKFSLENGLELSLRFDDKVFAKYYDKLKIEDVQLNRGLSIKLINRIAMSGNNFFSFKDDKGQVYAAYGISRSTVVPELSIYLDTGNSIFSGKSDDELRRMVGHHILMAVFFIKKPEVLSDRNAVELAVLWGKNLIDKYGSFILL